MKSLEAQRHVDPLPPKPTEKRREMSRVEMGRGGLFINTLESPVTCWLCWYCVEEGEGEEKSIFIRF